MNKIQDVKVVGGKTPFADPNDKKLIVHCCYHKVASKWLTKILRNIAKEYNLSFQNCRQKELRKNTDIFVQNHSLVNFSKLPSYKGSHIIRDPRDVIISGYFYHLWTDEKWAHISKEEFGNKSYQEYLNSLKQEEGILAEIKRASKEIKEMVDWNYNNSNFIEIKYEDLIYQEEIIFAKIFQHYGFNKEAIELSLKIADKHSFKNVAKRKIGEVATKSHLRSGRPSQWKELFSEQHKKYFKSLLGDAVVKLGYEANNDW